MRLDREDFCCGNEQLDRYLKQQAGQDSRKNAAAPFVLVHSGSKAVKGYYTLSMTAVDVDVLPQEIVRAFPKYPLIPAALLGRLAVDKSCRGQRIGRLLLSDALKRSLRSEIAWWAVVVENARVFYEHYGFIPFPDNPMKLFMPKKTIEQSLAGR